jgi:hypothetical protein
LAGDLVLTGPQVVHRHILERGYVLLHSNQQCLVKPRPGVGAVSSKVVAVVDSAAAAAVIAACSLGPSAANRQHMESSALSPAVHSASSCHSAW